MEISTGKFKIGIHQSNYLDLNNLNVIKDVEVWKTYTNGINKGRSLSLGNTHIWPSIIINNYGQKTFKFYSSIESVSIYNPTYYQFIDGVEPSYDVTNTIYPFGGFGQLNFISKESSLWYAINVNLHVQETQKINIDGTVKEEELLQFTKGASIKKYKIQDDELIYNYPGNENYEITEINRKIDKTNNIIDRYFKITKINQKDEIPLGYYDADFNLDYIIGPNNNLDYSNGYIEITYAYTYQKGKQIEIELNDVGNNILLAKWTQQPCMKYYCCMAWVENPSNTETEEVKIIEDLSVPYNSTNIELYLYIDFGISPNGGQDIYWNAYIKNDLNLDNILPNDVSNYISIFLSQNEDKDMTNKYGTFVVSKLYDNYYKVTGSSLPNNGYNNNKEDRTQIYKIENISISAPNKIEINDNEYFAANADNTDNTHTTNLSFITNKYTYTNPWNIEIYAELNYNNFHGSTNGESVIL